MSADLARNGSKESRLASVRHRLGVGSRRSAPSLVLLLTVLGAWYFLTYIVLSPERRFLLPAPHEIVAVLFDPRYQGDLAIALWRTTEVAAIGLIVAFVLGVTLAVLMSQAKWIENSLFPFAIVLQTVPILAIVPLIGFWAGYGTESRVIVCVLIALFPLIISTLNGLLSTDPLLRDLLKLHGAGRWTQLVKLQFPAALPDLFIGLRISAGGAVIGAIVGDFMFGQGQPGLGMVLQRYARTLESEALMAGVLLSCGLGVVVFTFFGFLGHRMVGSWSEAWRSR